MKQKILYAGKIYKIGTDIPLGTYLFFYLEKDKRCRSEVCNQEKAVVRLYFDSPICSIKEGYFGMVHISERYKYAVIENGVAVYCEENTMNFHELLQIENYEDGDYSKAHRRLFSAPMLEIDLVRKDSKRYLYTGHRSQLG